jgi:hypothetical protein
LPLSAGTREERSAFHQLEVERMSRDKDRYRENIANSQAELRDAAAAIEKRTEHPEERELAPEIPVAAVENPNDPRAPAPDAPGPRGGDQS